MFTGIVEEIGSVVATTERNMMVAAAKTLKGMQLGGSIAVNGVCLTVTRFDDRSFAVDVMPETRRRTNLGALRPGDNVNLERPLALGGELGGHLVQGHVDGTGRVASLTPEGEAVLVEFEAPAEIMRYVVPKGFIAVDGVSLTVAGLSDTSFTVSLVGFTRQHTVLGSRRTGDRVNLEVDIIAKYVERLSRAPGAGLTADFLKEHGFAVS